MALFKVGQRVRIKWSNGWPELAGQEGVIVQLSPDEEFEYDVAPDCWGSPVAPHLGSDGGVIFAPCAEQLEPIQYDGNKVIEWSECLWQPSRETA